MTTPKNSFLKGAVILTGATMLVKFIGMLYKIPLTNILGAVGMSYFNSAYTIFNPIYALSVSGLPVAVSKLVSENLALGRYRDVRAILRVSLGMFLALGLGGTLVLFFGANFFAGIIQNPDAALSVAVIAPSILFCCLMASWRGYYQGFGNMAPTAVSQVVESLVKLGCGIAFAWMTMQRGLAQYAETGRVFGRLAASPEQAELLVLPWAAAGAILGVTLSTAVGALVLFGRGIFGRDSLKKERIGGAPAARPLGELGRALLKIALPVCLASAFAHLANLIDLATIMTRVGAALDADPGAVMGMYADRLPDALTRAELPRFLYGLLTGYTQSLFNLVPAITVALGVSALPMISAQWALGQKSHVAAQCASVVKLAALAAIPMGLGLAALAEPILLLLYPTRPAEVALAAPLLRSMGVGAVLVGITSPVSSLFQALGRADLPLKLMVAGAALKVSANWVLVAVPGLNIYAAPIGTILCYAFVLLGGAILLDRVVGKPVKALAILAKPLLCGILCAVAAHTSYALLSRVWESRLVTLAAIAVGGLFYAIFVLFLKIITKNEVLFLPNGKKIAKILEKLALLG